MFKFFNDKNSAAPAPAAAAGKGASAAASRKRGRDGSAPPPAVQSKSALADQWRGTPIIVLPSTSTSSLITMYNVTAFLQEGRFVPPAEARAAYGSAPKPTKVVVRRKDSRGNMCQYYVIDSVELLKKREDWCVHARAAAAGVAAAFGRGRVSHTRFNLYPNPSCTSLPLAPSPSAG